MLKTAISLLVLAVIQVVVRLLFQGIPIIPHFVEFDPSVALVPAAGYFLGPAAACTSMAATILADHLTGMWSTISVFKAAGVLLMGLSAWALRSAGPFSFTGFMSAGLVSMVAGATWTGVGTEVLRVYPFAYVATLVLLHHAFFYVVLAPGLWKLGAHVPPLRGGGVAARTQVIGGAIGAWALGVIVSSVFYHVWPFGRYHLTDRAGIGVIVAITPLLALHVTGLWRAWRGAATG